MNLMNAFDKFESFLDSKYYSYVILIEVMIYVGLWINLLWG